MPSIEHQISPYQISPGIFGHIQPSELAQLDPKQHLNNRQVAAYNLVKLLNSIEVDPAINLAPKTTIVGGYCLDPNKTADIDVEVANVSWEHLQTQLLARKNEFEWFCRTKSDSDGLIKQNPNKKMQDGDIGGNVCVCVNLILRGGHSAHVSIPLKTNPLTNRYDMRSVEYLPTLSFEEASSRRTFAHSTIGYDIIDGKFIDPHDGLGALKERRFSIVNSDSALNDPLVFYTSIIEMQKRKLTPDARTASLLTYMSSKPIDADNPGVVSLARLANERAKIFTGDLPPSNGLILIGRFGGFQRDFSELESLKLGDLRALVGPSGLYDQIDSAWNSTRGEPAWKRDEVLVHVLGAYIASLSRVNNWSLEESNQGVIAKVVEKFIHPSSQNGSELIKESFQAAIRIKAHNSDKTW
jgi:hypothetical protein